MRSILIKECAGPDSEEGSGVTTVEYSCTSWSKPTAKADAGKTPEDKDKQKFVQQSEIPAGSPGANPTPTPPDVKP